MAKVTVTEFINAPIEVVFDIASDFGNADQRITGIIKTELLTDGEIGVGTRFKETRVMFKREASETMEVVKFERPYHYAVEAFNCGCEYHTSFDFAEKNGGTEISMTFEGIPKTIFAKMMAFMMGWMMKMVVKECTKDLADLKKSIEDSAVVV